MIQRLMSARMLILLVVGCASVPAVADQITDLIKSYGFEYRKDERPYGVPITATLSAVIVGEKKYQIDRKSPLTEKGMAAVIKTYLVTHAANDIELQSRLFGNPVGKVKIDVSKAYTEDFISDLVKPPLKSFRVRLAPFEYQGNKFEAHCDFHFIKIGEQFYQLYFSEGYHGQDSREPACDVRGGPQGRI